MTLAVVLLAAGRSRRMRGRDKLLETVDGIALLRCMAQRVLASGAGVLAVTLPQICQDRAAALDGLDLTRLPVMDADEGLAASLRAAMVWAKGINADGLMVCPADLPDLTASDFANLAQAFDPAGPPLRATACDGVPGHPVVFPARMFAQLASLSGDRGARDLLSSSPPRLIALPGRHATTDLDTPEDWSAWRRARRVKRCDDR